MRAGALIGLIAGVCWAVFAGRVGLPTPVWITAIVVVAALGVLGVRRAAGSTADRSRGFARNRGYWVAVALEVVLVAVGFGVLAATGHQEYGLCIVLVAVGVHFFPLARALFGRSIVGLTIVGSVLIACGAVLAALRLTGAPEWTFGVVGGVIPGLTLTGVPLLTRR